MKKQWVIFFYLTAWIFTGPFGHAQNLVPNGDFETYSGCPDPMTISQLSFVLPIPWTRPIGTPDYFNNCDNTNRVGVPINYLGTQAAHGGNAYAGYFGTIGINLDPREWLQAPLTSPLIKDHWYKCEMYLSLSEASLAASKIAGACFTKTTNVGTQIPQILSKNFVSDMLGWVLVADSFKATGGEAYITLGLFGKSTSANTIPVPPATTLSQNNSAVYYYIDDVSVVDITCNLSNTKNLLGNDTALCLQDSFSILLNATIANATKYTWSTGDTLPTLTIKHLGKYSIHISSSNPTCFLDDTIEVKQMTPPFTDLGPDTILCLNRPLILHSSFSYPDSVTTYQWNTGDTVPFLQVTKQGVYVLVVNYKGCKNADTVRVTQSPVTPFSLGPDTALCAEEPVLLTIHENGAIDYLWNTGKQDSFLFARSTGMYWAEARNGSCAYRDTVNLTIHHLPFVTLGNDTLVCEPDFMLSPGNGFASYEWQDKSKSPVFRATDYGKYTVKVVDANGCANQASIQLEKECATRILIPNVFTPNGDQKNDFFVIAIAGELEYDLTIYNRWGDQVFHSDHRTYMWNGNSASGSPCSPGVYYVAFNYRFAPEHPITYRGTVTLLR